MSDPRIIDNDAGEITATVASREVRGWSYKNDAERRIKMQMAHEFAEGWFQAATRLRTTITLRLEAILREMKPDYDDSIVGFNEAWDIVREIFAEQLEETNAKT